MSQIHCHSLVSIWAHITDCHSFDLHRISQFICDLGLIHSSKWYPIATPRLVNQTVFPEAGNQLSLLLNCQNSPWDGCVQGQLAISQLIPGCHSGRGRGQRPLQFGSGHRVVDDKRVQQQRCRPFNASLLQYHNMVLCTWIYLYGCSLWGPHQTAASETSPTVKAVLLPGISGYRIWQSK